jgi:hypothetical protein
VSTTDVLTGARIPTSGDAATIWTIIENAVKDLSNHTIAGPFANTAARDTAFASWVAAGGTLRRGLLSSVTGSGLWEYDGAGWKPFRGLVAPVAVGTAQFNNTGTTEVPITGTNKEMLISGVPLRSGNAYRVQLNCRPWAGVSNVVMALRIRVGIGTVTTANTAVAVKQIRQSGNDSNTAEDKELSAYFAVQANGTYNIRAFGIVASGSFAVGPDERGRYEMFVTDCGPSQANLVTVT